MRLQIDKRLAVLILLMIMILVILVIVIIGIRILNIVVKLGVSCEALDRFSKLFYRNPITL